MPKPWARQRARREAERRQLLEEEGAAAVQSVSTLNSVPISPAPAVPNSWLFPLGLGRDHPMYHASGLLPSTADDTPPPSPVDATPPSCWADDLPDPLSASARAVPLTLPPRDFSALCSVSAHPWRTIRRRNHRLLPQRRPFPRSLPKTNPVLRIPLPLLPPPSAPIHVLRTLAPRKVPAPPLPPPPPSPRPPGLSLRPVDLLQLLPLHCDDPIHPDYVPPVDMPAPVLCPCPADHVPPPVTTPIAPTFPAHTSYGPVQSSLALACAGQKRCADASEDLFDLVWGPYAGNKRKNIIMELPGDQLVFLCMLVEFVALERVFADFLNPVIADFANAFVDYSLRDSFG